MTVARQFLCYYSSFFVRRWFLFGSLYANRISMFFFSVLRVTSGPPGWLAGRKKCYKPPVVYSTGRSEAVVPVLALLFVSLWFILRGYLFYVLHCVSFFLCFSVLLALRLPRLRKRELVLVLFIRLFDLRLVGFVFYPFCSYAAFVLSFLFLICPIYFGTSVGCASWLCYSVRIYNYILIFHVNSRWFIWNVNPYFLSKLKTNLRMPSATKCGSGSLPSAEICNAPVQMSSTTKIVTLCSWSACKLDFCFMK